MTITKEQDHEKIIKKHFKKRRMLKLSREMFAPDVEHAKFFAFELNCTLIQVEGIVIEAISRMSVNHSSLELFNEIQILDETCKMKIPVIDISARDEKNNIKIQCGKILMCIGTIHYNWRPDMRADICYPVALKSFLIKSR